MVKLIAVEQKKPLPDLADYRPFAAADHLRELGSLARALRGTTIVHLNATARGGGVAELLKSQIPFERALGLRSHWFTFKAPRRFFVVTKKLHNLLQGASGMLSPAEIELWRETSWAIGRKFRNALKALGAGIAVIHDPQPLYLAIDIPGSFLPILRFHIDLSQPNSKALDLIRPLLGYYRRIIVSNPAYRRGLPRASIIMPAIDPLTDKNRMLTREAALAMLQKSGVAANSEDPLIAQVSRFDRWKNAMGVLHSYYRAKNRIPKLQLVLAGSRADDDPETAEIFSRVEKHSSGDPDIFLINEKWGNGDTRANLLINAIYTLSTAVIQNSIREGFGLTITEAMWKGKPVIARRNAGATIQIRHNKNGLLVHSTEAAALAIVRVVRDEKLRGRLGRAAHLAVHRRFLFPRYMRDHLRLYRQLQSAQARYPRR